MSKKQDTELTQEKDNFNVDKKDDQNYRLTGKGSNKINIIMDAGDKLKEWGLI